MLFANLLSLVTLGVLVAGHPGEQHHRISRSELIRRHAASAERHLVARKCASAISEWERKRMVARDHLMKRATAASTAAAPHVTEIQNTTCITAPEVVEGPYYIRNEYVRNDLREDQGGLKLILDIGVMDTSSCEPLNNAFVELWNANATGVYGGYDGSTGGGEGGGGAPSGAIPSGVAPTDTVSASGVAPSGAVPSGSPPDGAGGAGGASAALARNETFLRGGYFTDDNGIVEITTIYPGFYEGRTAHIHTMVHTDWVESANGTLVSDSGKLVHIGQFFFDDDWNDQVFALSPYSTNTQTRTLNDADGILSTANTDGYNAFVSLSLIGDDISEGVYGYITVGVDTSSSFTIANSNYNPVVISSLTAESAETSTAAVSSAVLAPSVSQPAPSGVFSGVPSGVPSGFPSGVPSGVPSGFPSGGQPGPSGFPNQAAQSGSAVPPPPASSASARPWGSKFVNGHGPQGHANAN